MSAAVSAPNPGLTPRTQAEASCGALCKAECPKVTVAIQSALDFLPNGIAAIISDYRCDAFKNVERMAFANRLIGCKFVREVWADDNKPETLSHALEVRVDQSSRKWFVLTQRFENYGVFIPAVEYQFRHLESTGELEVIQARLGSRAKAGAAIRCQNADELNNQLNALSPTSP